MAKWSFWDWVGYAALGLAAFGMALGSMLKDNGEVLALLPSFLSSPRWAYAPAILFTIGSIILLVRAVAPLATSSTKADAPTRPPIVQANEPRHNLDWKSSDSVLDLTEPRHLVERQQMLVQLADVERRIAELESEIQAGASDQISALQRLLSPPPDLEKKKRELKAEAAGRYRRQEVLYRLLIDDLYDKLRRGELVAQGFLLPVEKDSQVSDIPAERWRFLSLSPDFTKASGENLNYAGIAIAKPR